MAENKQYWEQLISEGLRFLQEQNNDAAAAVLQKADFDVEHSFHDSWRWGTDYWALIFYLKQSDYWDLGEEKNQAEKDIMSALVSFQKESRDLLSTVTIRPLAEEVNEWKAVLPFQKAAENAERFISKERYDSAFDRIYIALSDYIRHILTGHDVHFGADDSLTALLMELGGYYCSDIQLSGSGDKTKAILQNAGEIFDSIHELRNDNTAAHPGKRPLEKREAQLAVSLANSIVEYIEDIEETLS